MSFVGDPLAATQPILAAFLAEASGNTEEVERDAEIQTNIGWRPHLLERARRRAWHIHLSLPETDSWFRRIAKSRSVDPSLRIGVAAPLEVLINEECMLLCNDLDAEIISISSEENCLSKSLKYFASISDFIIETRAQLAPAALRKLLDTLFERAMSAKGSHRRGVLFELLVGLLLSQVRGFEVYDIGISNRSQQMDVLVQNRNAGGVLSASPIVVAEAKNWNDPVTPTEYAAFVRKLQSRHGRAKLGFLVTSGRFTQGVELERRRESIGEFLVVLVNGSQLVEIWRTDGAITGKIERLVMTATVGT